MSRRVQTRAVVAAVEVDGFDFSQLTTESLWAMKYIVFPGEGRRASLIGGATSREIANELGVNPKFVSDSVRALQADMRRVAAKPSETRDRPPPTTELSPSS